MLNPVKISNQTLFETAMYKSFEDITPEIFNKDENGDYTLLTTQIGYNCFSVGVTTACDIIEQIKAKNASK